MWLRSVGRGASGRRVVSPLAIVVVVLASCGSTARDAVTTSPAPTTTSTAVPVRSSTTAIALTTSGTTTATLPSTSNAVPSTFTPLGPVVPSGSPPLNVAWSRTTVAAGPYNGLVRSDGFGLTSVNSSTPGVVWISDDGVAWTARELPDGFAAIDSSRSRDLVALIGTRSSSTGKVPALAHSVDGSEWTVDVLDVGDLGPATRPDSRSQIAVSGQRIVAAVDAGPPAGSQEDTNLVFVGDGGPPFRRQTNTRFVEAQLSVGSQYIWWVSNELSAAQEPIATVFGPSEPIGTVDYASIDAGWQPVARVAGQVSHVGGRDAGEEYFAVSGVGSPSSVRAVFWSNMIVLDDEIARRAFDGMRWLRTCCNNAEPAIGVGQGGVAALVTSETGEELGTTPTPDLAKLAVATSPNGADWTVEHVGQLLPERGLDVTQLLVLDTRILVVVTDRYPQPDGSNPAIVLVGQIS